MQAVKNALGSVFFNKGENCIAAGRLFVEETIYDEFIEKYVFADDDGYVDPGSFCSLSRRPSIRSLLTSTFLVVIITVMATKLIIWVNLNSMRSSPCGETV